MHNYKLIILLASFVLLSVPAGWFLLKPLAIQNRLLKLLTPLVSLSIVTVCYFFWGGFADLYTFQEAEHTKQRALTVLKDLKSPQELITKLEKHLEVNPDSAKGWYLLGRVYASQNLPDQALAAFASAYQIKPDDFDIVVNYAQSLLVKKDNKGIELLENVLSKNPKNQDALAVLAMYYSTENQNSLAIKYWQILLSTLPTNSIEADDVRKIIAKLYK